MIRTTLLNLDPTAARASSTLGPRHLGELHSDEVLGLLQRFSALDPIENVEAEPEIVLEVRRSKHIVRTGQGRLFFCDPRNVLEQTLVLTPAEIIAEMDGSAAALRTRVPFTDGAAPTEDVILPDLPKPASALRPAHRVTLGAAAFFLAGYLLYPALTTETGAPAPTFEAIDDPAQAAAHRAQVAGVYLTGPGPGHYGIALAADGTLKLFQFNAEGPPGLIQDTFHVGQVDGTFAVQGNQQTEAMRMTTANTLTYYGNTYRRIP